MPFEGWLYAARWWRVRRRHQVARGWRGVGRSRRGRGRCDQVAGGWWDRGHAACAACIARTAYDEHTSVLVACRRAGSAGRWCDQIAGGHDGRLACTSGRVVDGRDPDRRDQKLSRLARLAHANSKARLREDENSVAIHPARKRAASRAGGSPNWRVYSRLN